jgi:aminopeptidase N
MAERSVMCSGARWHAALRCWRRGIAVLGATALLATLSIGAASGSAGAATSVSAQAPTPGSGSLGDRLYPTLGDGGYDPLHYFLNLRYATKSPAQAIDGTVTMTAKATQALSRFDLDFSGSGVGAVQVDGRKAHMVWTGGKLVITPAAPIALGQRFTVVVHNFTAKPTTPVAGEEGTTAFFITPDGSATAGQPNLMNSVYPCNDYPSEKATFSFRMDVPAGETAVANGDLTGDRTVAGRSIWTYSQNQPMATELTQLVAGDFTVVPRGKVDGVTVRDVIPTRLVGQYQKLLSVETSQMAWMEKRVGAFPFDQFGSLITDAPLGFALETQTLALYGNTLITDPVAVSAPTMLHELSHQWFGDSVTPSSWSDVWLNEGHATWYTYTYAADKGYLEQASGEPNFTALMKDWYAQGDQFRAKYGPVGLPHAGGGASEVENVFSLQAYYGGALTLYALRQRIGTPDFDRLERAWVSKFAGRSASTADFISLASAISGHDQNAFLRSWLYGTKTPPMPGHPDWTVTPVG